MPPLRSQQHSQLPRRMRPRLWASSLATCWVASTSEAPLRLHLPSQRRPQASPSCKRLRRQQPRSRHSPLLTHSAWHPSSRPQPRPPEPRQRTDPSQRAMCPRTRMRTTHGSKAPSSSTWSAWASRTRALRSQRRRPSSSSPTRRSLAPSSPWHI